MRFLHVARVPRKIGKLRVAAAHLSRLLTKLPRQQCVGLAEAAQLALLLRCALIHWELARKHRLQAGRSRGQHLRGMKRLKQCLGDWLWG